MDEVLQRGTALSDIQNKSSSLASFSAKYREDAKKIKALKTCSGTIRKLKQQVNEAKCENQDLGKKLKQALVREAAVQRKLGRSKRRTERANKRTLQRDGRRDMDLACKAL